MASSLSSFGYVPALRTQNTSEVLLDIDRVTQETSNTSAVSISSTRAIITSYTYYTLTPGNSHQFRVNCPHVLSTSLITITPVYDGGTGAISVINAGVYTGFFYIETANVDATWNLAGRVVFHILITN